MRLWLCVAVISFALTGQAQAGDVDWSAYIDDKPAAPMKTTFSENKAEAPPPKATKGKRVAKAKKATKAKRKAKAKRVTKKRRR